MIRGMHRIVLFCRDPETSKQWYERVGFRYLYGHGGMHWFAWGDGEIMLHPARDLEETAELPAGPGEGSAGTGTGPADERGDAVGIGGDESGASGAEIGATSAAPRSADANTPSFHAAVEDVDALFARVRAAGLTPRDFASPDPLTEPVVRPWGEREFELADPDGHRWAFTETAPEEKS